MEVITMESLDSFIIIYPLTTMVICQTSSEGKAWITAEILDTCDKRRELRKNQFKPEGSKKYKEVNNNIKRCMKKAPKKKKKMDRRTV